MTEQPFTKLQKLIDRAYAPYSGFRVAALLRDVDGRDATGVNVENASYGLTSCAERNAVFQFVAAGLKKPARLYLLSETDGFLPPCGACRQVLLEFDPDLMITIFNREGESRSHAIADLVPHAFTAEDLGGET